MYEEDSDQTAPNQPSPDGAPTQHDHAAHNRWNHQAENDPQWKEAARNSERWALPEIGDVMFESRRVRLKKPANVGVPEALQQTKHPMSLMPRRMGVMGCLVC